MFQNPQVESDTVIIHTEKVLGDNDTVEEITEALGKLKHVVLGPVSAFEQRSVVPFAIRRRAWVPWSEDIDWPAFNKYGDQIPEHPVYTSGTPTDAWVNDDFAFGVIIVEHIDDEDDNVVLLEDAMREITKWYEEEQEDRHNKHKKAMAELEVSARDKAEEIKRYIVEHEVEIEALSYDEREELEDELDLITDSEVEGGLTGIVIDWDARTLYAFDHDLIFENEEGIWSNDFTF